MSTKEVAPSEMKKTKTSSKKVKESETADQPADKQQNKILARMDKQVAQVSEKKTRKSGKPKDNTTSKADIKADNDERQVFVKGLAKTVNEDMLRQYFSAFGGVAEGP